MRFDPALAVLLGAALLAPPSSRAAAQSPGARRYRLSSSSRFEIRTTSKGLFGFAGDEHLIRAGAFTGDVTYDPDDPAGSRVELAVPADSLQVLTPVDEGDRRAIRSKMLEEVLRAGEHPEIHFRSTSVAPLPADSLEVTGDLTIRGTTRSVTIRLGTHLAGDTLRVFGGFDALLGDYEIDPPTVALGTVKVGDRVHFVVDATLVGRPPGSARDERLTSVPAFPPGPPRTRGR